MIAIQNHLYFFLPLLCDNIYVYVKRIYVYLYANFILRDVGNSNFSKIIVFSCICSLFHTNINHMHSSLSLQYVRFYTLFHYLLIFIRILWH